MCHNYTDVSHYCEEKNIEIFAVQLEVRACHFFIICIYRGTSGNFSQFVRLLDLTLYQPKTDFLICGNINVDYLLDTDWKNNFRHS
jgi:hypothetical protein